MAKASGTFARLVIAVTKYARETPLRDAAVKPHAYVRDRHSGAGNCEVCHRGQDFWAHWRPEW